jgi:hypothetical protein
MTLSFVFFAMLHHAHHVLLRTQRKQLTGKRPEQVQSAR